MGQQRKHDSEVIDALEVRRNRLVMTVAALPLVLAAVLVLASVLLERVMLALVPHLTLLGTVLLVYLWRRNPWPRHQPVEARVDEAWLQVGRRRLPRRQIRQADVVPDGDGARLRLHRGWPRPAVELRCLSEPDARVLARRLGLDASQTVASFRAMARAQATTARRVGTILGTIAFAGACGVAGNAIFGPAAMAVAVLLGSVAMLVLTGAPTRVEVGTDGVLLRWLGTRRFLRHDEIEGVYFDLDGIGSAQRKHVCLSLRGGEQLRIPVASLQWEFGRAEALRVRIEQAGAAFRRGSAEGAAPILLRGGRSPDQWVAELRTCCAKLQHRVAAVVPDQLWPLVEDAAGSELVRAAAAVALGADLTPTERQRLALVSKSTASPRLRVALDAVAGGGDEQALAEALGVLEAAEADREHARR